MADVSATIIDTYLLCPRKWAWIYLERLPRTESPSAALGTMVHLQLENYLRDATPLDFTTPPPDDRYLAPGYIAHSALEFLPEPKLPEDWLEHEFAMRSANHTYYGKIDIFDHHQQVVYDHKTSASPKKWGKRPEDLDYDPQAIIYAAHAYTVWKQPTITLQWTYMATQRKVDAFPVRRQLTVEHVGTVFAEIERVADEIHEIKRSGKRALDLVPNPRACKAYGGCPFVEHCNLSPLERMEGYMSEAEGTAALLARLAARAALPAPAEIAATPGPVAPTVPDYSVNPPEATAPQVATQPRDGATPPNGSESEKVDVKPSEIRADKDAAKRRNKRAALNETTAKESTPIGTLFVNCVVPGATGFETLLDKAYTIIENTEFKNQDGQPYRIRDYRFMPYGQGPAVLLSAVIQALQEGGRVEELVIDGATPEAAICLNALLLGSSRVIRGTR